MKRNISMILILFIWIPTNLFAQQVEVTYSVKKNTHAVITSTQTEYRLLIQGGESFYFNDTSEDALSQFQHKGTIATDLKDNTDMKTIKLSDNHYAIVIEDFFYKNYSDDTLILNDYIIRKKIIIGESISKLFSWTITPDKDSLILGYKCQEATAEFRGRKYIAYFNSEINPFGGPWKFDGLPGIILAVRSLDNYFIIEPLKIAINTPIQIPNNPYKDMKQGSILSWEGYKKAFRKKLEDQLNLLKSMSSRGEGGSIRISDKIEDIGFTEISFTK